VGSSSFRKLPCDALHRASPDPERLGHFQHLFLSCWASLAYHHGRGARRAWPPADHWGQIMKRLTSAGLFVSPKTARKANVRVEHAKLVVASAREHAAKTAQRYEEEWRKKKWRWKPERTSPSASRRCTWSHRRGAAPAPSLIREGQHS
jgi:hypothetical protein